MKFWRLTAMTLVMAVAVTNPAAAQTNLSHYGYCYYGGGFLEPRYFSAVFEYEGDIKDYTPFRNKVEADFKDALEKNFRLHANFSDPAKKITVHCNYFPQNRDSREQVQGYLDRKFARPSPKGLYETDWVPGKVRLNSTFHSR